VRLDRIRIERSRSFGHVWLGWTLWRALDLDRLCGDWMVDGREQIPWATMAAILTIARLCEPSSELHIAEDWYRRTALEDLLGVPSDQVNDDRLYRALDRLLPHKTAIEQHLKNRLGELFALEYDLLLYDVTSTYFEGLAATSRRASKRDSSASDAASRARRRNSIEDPSSARSVGCSVATREPRGRYAIRLADDASAASGLRLDWSVRADWDDWSRHSEGCYVLRTNVHDWTPEALWQTYVQLTEAEAAFRIQKSDLSLRPIWHHKQGRVQAHIFVCFLASRALKDARAVAQARRPRQQSTHDPVRVAARPERRRRAAARKRSRTRAAHSLRRASRSRSGGAARSPRAQATGATSRTAVDRQNVVPTF
jgi:hypothetical protein